MTRKGKYKGNYHELQLRDGDGRQQLVDFEVLMGVELMISRS